MPACQGIRPAVVRTTAPATLVGAPPDMLLGEITAGLTARFTNVLPIEVAADPAGVPRGSVRLVHAALAPDGEGVAIETLLRRGGEVTCWVSPAARYPAERTAARRAMAGRPPLRAERREPDPTPISEPVSVPVTEARLTVFTDGDREPGDWVVVRHGPAAHVLPASLTEPEAGVELPASALPLWMATVTGTGPRPVPGEHPLLITTRPALDRLLARTDPSDAEVRTALNAPDLPDADAAGLAALVRGSRRHWSLEWIAGAQESADDWSPARAERRGRVEVLDAGPSGYLWRVLTGLPGMLTDELPPAEEPVALARASASGIWHDLTLPIAA